MLIIGIHNTGILSSAAAVVDGQLVFGCAEERLDRRKFSKYFPHKAIQACLSHVGGGQNQSVGIQTLFLAVEQIAHRCAISMPRHDGGLGMKMCAELGQAGAQLAISGGALNPEAHHRPTSDHGDLMALLGQMWIAHSAPRARLAPLIARTFQRTRSWTHL